ncbi:hypothetical protein Salat_1412400 [Sesamum alatum]|uniref:Uncharacterized protein n=1 Tax=Sesamum alatum TaxID=300844 RepID=A0AAE2CLE2_9LAMI|nr:hypothetical protein Salat_1412400 [Sesamum alatum]
MESKSSFWLEIEPESCVCVLWGGVRRQSLFYRKRNLGGERYLPNGERANPSAARLREGGVLYGVRLAENRWMAAAHLPSPELACWEVKLGGGGGVAREREIYNGGGKRTGGAQREVCRGEVGQG